METTEQKNEPILGSAHQLVGTGADTGSDGASSDAGPDAGTGAAVGNGIAGTAFVAVVVHSDVKEVYVYQK